MRRFFAVALAFAITFPTVAQEKFKPSGGADNLATRVAAKGKVLYDSGVVASGAIITSGVLSLDGISELEVIADNTAGSVFRDLTMVSYLDNGTTQIDSLLLRRVVWGAAANGADYDPGRVRVLIGANPPGVASGVHVLYSTTSAAATALDTGALDTEDADYVTAYAVPSAGTTQLQGFETSDAGVYSNPSIAPSASSGQTFFWGPGSTLPSGAVTGYTSYVPSSVPRRLRFTTTSAASSNTVLLRVVARGRRPGTSSVSMVLPTRAKVTLAAAGAANGRLTVIGR